MVAVGSGTVQLNVMDRLSPLVSGTEIATTDPAGGPARPESLTAKTMPSVQATPSAPQGASRRSTYGLGGEVEGNAEGFVGATTVPVTRAPPRMSAAAPSRSWRRSTTRSISLVG